MLRSKKQTLMIRPPTTSKNSAQASLAAIKTIGTATSTAISARLGHPNLSQLIGHVMTLMTKRTSTRAYSAPVINNQILMATALTWTVMKRNRRIMQANSIRKAFTSSHAA